MLWTLFILWCLSFFFKQLKASEPFTIVTANDGDSFRLVAYEVLCPSNDVNCRECKIKEVLNDLDLCIPCPDSCLECYKNENWLSRNDLLYCSNNDGYYILSPLQTSFLLCPNYCTACYFIDSQGRNLSQVTFNAEGNKYTRLVFTQNDLKIVEPVILKCQTCKEGHTLNFWKETCIMCNENCLKCKSVGNEDGNILTPYLYDIFKGFSLEDIKKKETNYINFCSQSKQGYYINALGMVKDCPYNCLICKIYIKTGENPLVYCVKCVTGFYYLTTEGECLTCPTQCLKCGYFKIFDGSSLSLDVFPLENTGFVLKCTWCNENYYLNDNYRCIYNENSYAYKDYNCLLVKSKLANNSFKCSICKENYYPSFYNISLKSYLPCYKKEGPCFYKNSMFINYPELFSSTYQCEYCYSEYPLEYRDADNQLYCYQTCDQLINYFFPEGIINFSKDKKISYNYYLIPLKGCVKCPLFCKKCQNDPQTNLPVCLTCIETGIFDVNSKVCKFCPPSWKACRVEAELKIFFSCKDFKLNTIMNGSKVNPYIAISNLSNFTTNYVLSDFQPEILIINLLFDYQSSKICVIEQESIQSLTAVINRETQGSTVKEVHLTLDSYSSNDMNGNAKLYVNNPGLFKPVVFPELAKITIKNLQFQGVDPLRINKIYQGQDYSALEFKNVAIIVFYSVIFQNQPTLIKISFSDYIEMHSILFINIVAYEALSKTSINLIDLDTINYEISLESISSNNLYLTLEKIINILSPRGKVELKNFQFYYSFFNINQFLYIENMASYDCTIDISDFRIIHSNILFSGNMIKVYKSFTVVNFNSITLSNSLFYNSKLGAQKNNYLISIEKSSVKLVFAFNDLDIIGNQFYYSSLLLIYLDKITSQSTISNLLISENQINITREAGQNQLIAADIFFIEVILVLGNLAPITLIDINIYDNEFTNTFNPIEYVTFIKITNSLKVGISKLHKLNNAFINFILIENVEFLEIDNIEINCEYSLEESDKLTQIMQLSNLNQFTLANSVFNNFVTRLGSGIKVWNDKLSSTSSKPYKFINNTFQNITIKAIANDNEKTLASLLVIYEEEKIDLNIINCVFSVISINSAWLQTSNPKSSSAINFQNLLGQIKISNTVFKMCNKPLYFVALIAQVEYSTFENDTKLSDLTSSIEKTYSAMKNKGGFLTVFASQVVLRGLSFKGGLDTEMTGFYMQFKNYNLVNLSIEIIDCSFIGLRALYSSIIAIDAHSTKKQVKVIIRNLDFRNNMIFSKYLNKNILNSNMILIDTSFSSTSYIEMKDVKILNSFILNNNPTCFFSFVTFDSPIFVNITNLLMLTNNENVNSYTVPETFIRHESNNLYLNITSSKFSQLLFGGEYFLVVPFPANPTSTFKVVLDNCIFEYFIVFNKNDNQKALIYCGLQTSFTLRKSNFIGNYIENSIADFNIIKLSVENQIDISGCFFTENEATSNGTGIYIEGINMKISSSTFASNKFNCILISSKAKPNKFEIISTTFERNFADHALQISYICNTYLTSNLFKENLQYSKAIINGIDIIYKIPKEVSQTIDNTRLSIQNCTFYLSRSYVLLYESYLSGNISQISSRIYYPFKAPLFLADNKFLPEQQNMSGLFKGNPVRLAFKKSSLGINLTLESSGKYILWNQTSGEIPSVDLVLALYDIYNNELTFEMTTTLSFIQINNTKFDIVSPSTETLTTIPGKVNSIIFKGSRNEYYEINMLSSLIQTALIPNNDFLGKEIESLLETLTLGIYFRDCYIGEEYIENSLQCSKCPKGKYLLSKNKIYCDSCLTLEGVESCENSKIILIEGYWRSGPYSDSIVKCGDAPFNCLGGDGSGFNCSEGHLGYLCSECDIYSKVWKESYSKGSKFTCGKCSEISMNAIRIIGVSVLTIISLAISVRSTIALMERLLKVNILKIFSRKLVEENSNLGAVYIKIFVNYFQIISCVWTFQIKLPPQLIVVPDMIGSPVEQLFYSVDCFLVTLFEKKTLPFIYARLIFIILTPLFYLLIFLFIYFSYSLAFGVDKRLRKSILITSSLFIFLYLQPNVITYAISLLSCIQHEDQYFVKANTSFLCYTSEFDYFSVALVLPIFLFFSLLFPLLVLGLLVYKRKELVKSKVRMKFGFLYNEYTQKGFYWEFVKMYQRIAIITLLSMLGPFVNQKGILILFVVFIYGIWAYRLRPYASLDLNELDRKSTISCFYTIFLGLLLYNNNDLFSWISYLCLAAIGIINLKFIYSILMKIAGQKLIQIARLIDQLNIPIFSKLFARSIKKAKAEIISFSTAKRWARVKLAYKNYFAFKNHFAQTKRRALSKNVIYRTSIVKGQKDADAVNSSQSYLSSSLVLSNGDPRKINLEKNLEMKKETD